MLEKLTCRKVDTREFIGVKMSLWYKEYKAEQAQSWCENTMVTALDIIIRDISSDSITGIMPVTDKIKQPYGIVHGGANCALAETLGSIAANMTLNSETHHAVGLNISTSHIKAVRNGKVRGVAKNIHKGKTTQIWEIRTYNDANDLTSTSTLTMAIIEKLNK